MSQRRPVGAPWIDRSMNHIKYTAYRTILRLLVLLIAVQSVRADDLGDAIQAAIRKVEPSIVRLRVIGGEQSIDGDLVKSLVTTGIVISSDGEILTSQFALEGQPEAVLVEDQSGKRTNATIVATDSVRRIVLLKAREGNWTPVTADENSSPQVGQWSVALGRFYAPESSNVSVGIVSALNRIHGMAIQTDAKISPVNYGGPLISLNGDVLGVLVPLSPRGVGSPGSGVEWYDSGIGFAIPLKAALASAEKLRAGKDLKPGRVGVRLVPAGAFSAKVEIERVHPGGPAERAGIRKGDNVLAIDGEVVGRSSVLMESLARHYAGDTVALRVRRGEEELMIAVELVEALTPLTKGYLGLMPVRIAESKDQVDVTAKMTEDGKAEPLELPGNKLPGSLDEKAAGQRDKADSVALVVLNKSPAESSKFPTGFELLSINGTKTNSIGALAHAVEDISPEVVATLEYRALGKANIQTAELTSTSRPDSVVELSESVLQQLQQMQPGVVGEEMTAAKEALNTKESAPENGVARQELGFGERGRSVVLTSSQPAVVMPGIVILLAAHDTSEEEIVRQWGPFLRSHCLAVAIPKNPESARLTSDDVPLVLTTIRAMVSRVGADLQRVVVVADRTQAGLAWQSTFGGPSGIRGIVLTDGWFSTSDIQSVDGAGQSVLLLDPAEGVQARALMELSRKSLRAAGFWAPLPFGPDTTEGAAAKRSEFRTIADWTLQLRSF